jgi:hypothetical protein
MLPTVDRSWKMAAAIYAMLIYSSMALAAQNSSVLMGRFAVRMRCPVLTSFGTNHEFYVFEITSTPNSQFVVLSYAFLLYEPRLPHVLDYSHLYTFNAEPNEQCRGSIEEISRHYLFDEHGTFAGVRAEIEYSKNGPRLKLPRKTRLPCYLLDWETVSLIAKSDHRQ